MTLTDWPAGLVPALVTPLRDDALDFGAFAQLVELHVESGSRGLVVGGGTGEFGALSLEERRELVDRTVAIADGRIPVIAQTGTLATRDSIALSSAAQSSGADALLIASPFGEPISWRERLHFYEDVTAEVSLPIMIYNTPPSGLLGLEQIQQLAALPNVSAVKDSSGDAQLMGDLVAWARSSDFAIYVGSDSLMFDAFIAGVRGVVFGVASFIPGPLTQMADALRTHGPDENSHQLWTQLRPLLRFMEDSSNYIALCKAAHTLQGLDVGTVRAPYLMPEDDEVVVLAGHLERVKTAFDSER